MQPESRLASHEVMNQPETRGDRDLWASDPVLRTHAAQADVAALGRRLGAAEVAEWGREANRNLPELRAFDAAGRRIDEVAFCDAYHRLLSLGLGAGYASGPWTGGTHLRHAAMVYLMSQVEPGTCCPMTMTYAAVPALRAAPQDVAAAWVPKLTAAEHDAAVAPVSQKRAATLGMAMTEKQGGSDVRSNVTRAERAGGSWALTGHKWFCSAPMSDGFLTLAQSDAGLSCFLVPRWLEDGTRNAIHIQRLKDKLGNRANASAEIEYHGALGSLVGEEGRGVPAIMAMVHHTRLDTAIAPVGLMRAALDHLSHWVLHRMVFQRRLADQPLMRTLLADLALDLEGAAALGFHVARAFDEPARAPFARIAVALAKFLNNKLAPRVIVEAMEGLGGMGYVEDTALPLLYREAPLNGIWEGSGNVICLDMLRTLAKEPQAGAQLAADLDAARGADRRFDAALDAHRARWPGPPEEAHARWFAERLALLLTASVLIRQSPGPVADAYIATRLGGERGHVAGSMAPADTAAILDRLGPGFR